MSFDIQQPVFDPDGEYLEEAAERYRAVLMEAFEGSSEGQDLVRHGGTVGWAETFMELGMGYLEVTPATMAVGQVQTSKQQEIRRQRMTDSTRYTACTPNPDPSLILRIAQPAPVPAPLAQPPTTPRTGRHRRYHRFASRNIA